MEVTKFQERHALTLDVIMDCVRSAPANKWRSFNDQTAFFDSKSGKPATVHVLLGCSSDAGALTAPHFLKHFQDFDHARCFFGKDVGRR